jgi:hypothetical protein
MLRKSKAFACIPDLIRETPHRIMIAGIAGGLFNKRRGILHPERAAFGWRWIATHYYFGVS